MTDADDSGTEPVTLDGTGSTDPDGLIVTFAWSEGATILGTGASTMSAVTLRLTIPAGRLLKKLSPGPSIAVGDVAPGASVSATWTASADKRGSGTITADALVAGVSVATATHDLTVVK